MDTPAVEITGLVKDFHVGLRGAKVRAVDELTLSIPEGGVYGLLGPNGCGKSTTLKVVLGLLRPTRGSVRVFGLPADSPAARAQVGFLPEGPFFHKHLTGREFVRYCARLSGVSAKDSQDAAARSLELVGLTGAADRRVGTYSRGMLQRLGVAQAVAHDPRLVILDEPTAAVDPVGAAAMAEIIRDLKRRGKTVILCSHLLGQVEEVCDRVAIMDRGRLTLEGEIDAVLARPGRTQLEVENLSPEARAAVEAALAAHGATLKGVSHPRDSLDRIFLDRLSDETRREVTR
jgi:ABC-2 type transport system ATP-binding protein